MKEKKIAWWFTNTNERNAKKKEKKFRLKPSGIDKYTRKIGNKFEMEVFELRLLKQFLNHV